MKSYLFKTAWLNRFLKVGCLDECTEAISTVSNCGNCCNNIEALERLLTYLVCQNFSIIY